MAAQCGDPIGRHDDPGRTGEPSRRPREGLTSSVIAAWDDRPVNIRRVSWTVTVGVCLLIGLLLLVSGYQGYAAVALAVGASAALNLT